MSTQRDIALRYFFVVVMASIVGLILFDLGKRKTTMCVDIERCIEAEGCTVSRWEQAFLTGECDYYE